MCLIELKFIMKMSRKNIENKRNWKIVVREGIADFEIFNVEQY